jgi:hypothetical protein
MNNLKSEVVKYFGYGTNRDHDMMAAMIGRDNLVGESGKLLGYDLCIQKMEHIPDVVLTNAPVAISPKTIVSQFGPEFELYIVRPNSNGITYGTIWDISPEEYDLVREWELLDFGMQQDLPPAEAVNEKGEKITVTTHGSLDPALPIDRIVTGDNYEDYLIPKADILRVAVEARRQYFERIQKKNNEVQ